MSTVEALYREGKKCLEQAGIENSAFDARILLEWILNFTHADFILEAGTKVDREKEEQYRRSIEKRSTHYPLQYIMQSAFFMDFEFYVDEAVLIPRQDTEILVETVLEKEKNPQSILDICTGSGCIAISLKKYLKNTKVTAVDISDAALAVAKKNAKNLDVTVQFLQSDLFDKVEGRFDVLISNPPYIKTEEIGKLMDEVRVFEPKIALDGRQDGLFFYDQLLKRGRQYLKSGGRFYFEIGCEQARDVTDLCLKYGYQNVKIVKDLAGLDRVVYGESPM